MWQIESFELREITFDYSASSQDMLTTKAVYSAGMCLINNLAQIDFSDDPVQMRICDCCGFPDCGEGGYVSLRRLGQHVIWIPAFASMCGGYWELRQFAAPAFFS